MFACNMFVSATCTSTTSAHIYDETHSSTEKRKLYSKVIDTWAMLKFCTCFMCTVGIFCSKLLPWSFWSRAAERQRWSRIINPRTEMRLYRQDVIGSMWTCPIAIPCYVSVISQTARDLPPISPSLIPQTWHQDVVCNKTRMMMMILMPWPAQPRSARWSCPWFPAPATSTIHVHMKCQNLSHNAKHRA